MRINDRQIAHFAKTSQRVDKQGWLYKKGVIINQNYKKRWFRLKGNLLFYYKSDQESEPIGVIILERCRVETCVKFEGDLHSFKILFDAPPNTPSRDYHLGTDSEEDMMAWIKAISEAPIEYLLAVISDLKRRVELAEAEAEAEAEKEMDKSNESPSDDIDQPQQETPDTPLTVNQTSDGAVNLSTTSGDLMTPLNSPSGTNGGEVFLADATTDAVTTDEAVTTEATSPSDNTPGKGVNVTGASKEEDGSS